MNNINIVDAPCGYGKTSWAIQDMNNTTNTHRFIYVTPYLNEIKRFRESVKNKSFFEPEVSRGGNTKIAHLHKLLTEGQDICTTHSLFQMANKETRRLIKEGGYTLILDEVLNVIQQVELKRDSLQLLIDAGAVYLEENSNGIVLVKWNEEKREYRTEYDRERNMALSGNLIFLNNTALMWNFPVDIFSSFNDVYILTYLFKGQLQRYYYDLHGIKYRYLSVEMGKDGEYELIPYDQRKTHDKSQLSLLINIYGGKLNGIGEARNALSSTWLNNKENTKQLKKDAYNYLANIVKANS